VPAVADLILFMGFMTFLAGAFGAFDAAVRRGGSRSDTTR
jgi:hypothetical protein